ncbi:hypothetical protein NDU88_004007 [Pleurodeles waltl]|uniref:Uncharacterized protein n=1 Tax=Pleurodeles waltl TaxID=8319 RepID=A0AAV7MS98_PLEWA|nr:hypothetical protein NDU88_004007 [Pleurodeles waltl]
MSEALLPLTGCRSPVDPECLLGPANIAAGIMVRKQDGPNRAITGQVGVRAPKLGDAKGWLWGGAIGAITLWSGLWKGAHVGMYYCLSARYEHSGHNGHLGKGPAPHRYRERMAEDGAPQSIDVELAKAEEARASGGVPGGESSGWRESEQFWANFAAKAKANGWGGWEMAMAHMRAPTAHGRGQSVDKEELQPRMVAVTGHTYSLPQGEQPETKGKVKRARGSGTSKAKKTKKTQEENRLAMGVSIDHKVGTSLVRVPVPLRPIGDEQEPSNKGSTLTPEAGDLGHVRRGADTFKGFGQGKEGKDRKRVRPEENIMNWLDAFALLAAIFLERYP